MKKIMILSVIICLILALYGCSKDGTVAETSDTSEEDTNTNVIDVTSKDDMFSDFDLSNEYDQNGNTIAISEDAIKVNGEIIAITDDTMTINKGGTYILSGQSQNLMIVIDAGNEDVYLVLDNISITNESAVLYIKNANKVYVITTEGSVNDFTSTDEFVQFDENNVDATIFSKSDLIFSGLGSLEITSCYGHGVVSKDDLIMGSGDYVVTASKKGLSANDSVRIADGNYAIVSGKDAIAAENSDDLSKGYIYIADGTFSIASMQDGISSSNYVWIENGIYQINTQTALDLTVSGVVTAESYEQASTKGIKADGMILITAGEFTITAIDDGVHAHGPLSLADAKLTISSGDDGIHTDDNLSVNGADINIIESYEGLEGNNIDIIAGTITIHADDDGINAAGGNDQSGFEQGMGPRPNNDQFVSDSDSYITIDNGQIYIDANGDGIDSNGSLAINGGKIYVSASSMGGNGALDYATQGIINGGTIIAAGTADMALNFTSASSQGSILVNTDQYQANESVSLFAGDEEIITWNVPKDFSSVLISTPEIVIDGVYKLVVKDKSYDITMDNLLYSYNQRGNNMNFDKQPPEMGRK